MTNLVATLIITLSTNWTTIGTFTPSCGQSGCLVIHPQQDVQEGVVEKNFHAQVEFNGTKHLFLLEKKIVRKIGERKVQKPQQFYYLTNWASGFNYSNLINTNLTL